MAQLITHSECVDSWLARARPELTPAREIDLYDRAFAAIWSHAHRTLGEITLTAIVDRVLTRSLKRYPLLAKVRVIDASLSLAPLHGEAAHHPHNGEALRFVLVELLRVLGSVTAEVLTPTLHQTLADVTLAPAEAVTPSDKATTR